MSGVPAVDPGRDDTVGDTADTVDTDTVVGLGADHGTGSPDHDRLARVYRDGRGALLHASRRRTGDAGRAEDAVAEALVRGLRRVEPWASDEHCLRWLHAAAASAAVDQHRRLRAVATSRTSDAAPDPGPGPEQQALLLEAVAEVGHAMARLSASDRDLLVARGVDGRSVASLAVERGVVVGSAEMALHRARARLRALLDGRPVVVLPAAGPWLRRLLGLAPTATAPGAAMVVAGLVAATAVAVGTAPGLGRAADAGTLGGSRDLSAAAASAASPDLPGRADALGPAATPTAAPVGTSRTAPARTTRVWLPADDAGHVVLPGAGEGAARGGAHVRVAAAGTSVEGGADTPLPEQVADDHCVVVDPSRPDPTPGSCPADEDPGGDVDARAEVDHDADDDRGPSRA